MGVFSRLAVQKQEMVFGVPLLPAVLLLVVLVAVVVLRSRSTSTKVVCEAVMLVTIGAALLERGTSPLPTGQHLAHSADAPWLRALAVVWWLIGARLTAIITVLALGRDARSRQARLVTDLLAGGIYLTAILIILNSVLDLPINGLLATSGVIAIVLGLALQNTLGDVFSGIAVGLEQPFHVGDRITIAEHAEGVVVEMNWRSIRIQTDGEDVATIPNSIVARSQIINRSVPSERRAASIEVPTTSGARSERLIDLVHQAILLCPDVLTEPVPTVSIKRIRERTTTLGINYFVGSTGKLTIARGQLLRQVRRLFRHAGIGDGTAETPTSLLSSIPLFESLSPSQIELLVNGAAHRSLAEGEVLFEQGSHGASLYVMRSGIFEVSRTLEEGGSEILGRVGPGEYLGEISMMSGDPRAATVVTLARGSVLEVTRAALDALLKEDRALSAALERSVKQGLVRLGRDHAARACEPLDPAGSVISRIRNYLGLNGRAA